MATTLTPFDAAAPKAEPAPTRATLPRVALGPVLVVVLVKLAIGLAAAGRYGWHRDELYYFSTGRHLDLGFVDLPPVTAVLAALSRALFGSSLVGLRSFALLAGAGVVVLVALTARELGGRTCAQVVAAIAITPLTLGSNAMFQTVSFDQLAWAAIALLTLRVLRDPSAGRWLALGATAGLAWQTKYTVGLLLVGLVVGLVATAHGRDRLRDRGAWAGASLAIALAAPNLWWQARHGWPSLDFFTGRSDVVRDEYPPWRYAVELIVLAGPPAIPLWLTGGRRLLRRPDLRVLGLAALIVVIGFAVLGGKSYYAAPVLAPVLAAGAVAWEERVAAGRRRRLALPVALVVLTSMATPMILPVLDQGRMVDLRLHELREDYAEEIGWPELVESVADVYRALPDEGPRPAILAGNYGEAGAIDLFGAAHGLPSAVSGHVTHRYWTPDRDTLAATTLVVVGYRDEWIGEECQRARRAGTVTNAAGIDNEEQGGPIWICDLPGTLADLWPSLGHDGG